MTSLLSCADLSRTFGALRAVDQVSLDVAEGSRHALIGPNGAGKSTLFKLFCGSLRPTSGHVRFAGRDVTRLSEVRRARLGIGQTFQHSSLFLTMTAAQNVTLAAQRHGGRPATVVPMRQRAVADQVAALLDDVDLGHRADVTVGSLSHGERRQLEVAVALACRPRLLLLDEPAAGMSPAESGRFAELMERLPDSITVLFVEHDLDLVFRLAHRVSVLHVGKVLHEGAPDEVRASDAVQQAYLGTGRREDLFLTDSEEGSTPTGGEEVDRVL